jgi:putative ABC transport system permease protein
MTSFIHDLRYAIRLLLKSPGFTLVAVITLALGIGANTAIFTVVNAVLLRPLPFRDPSRLVIIAEKSKLPVITVSYQNWVDWRNQSRSFESVEGTVGGTIALTGRGDPQRLKMRYVTAGVFPLLGISAYAGRTFLPSEDRAGAERVAMLSYGLWQRRFGGATGMFGQSIILDSQPYTVVGVLPPQFELLQPADVYLPFIPWAAKLPNDRNWHPGIIAIARLKSGVSRDEARAEMLLITKRLEQQYPDYNTGYSADVVGLQDQMVKNVRPGLILLLAAVLAVLLIACVNVANLLLARGASRGREVAIRISMGASRGRIIRQLLTESAVMALAGGFLGVLLALLSLEPLLQLASGSIPKVFSVELDYRVLIFTFALSVATGVVFGIVPALRTARQDLRSRLNESGRGSTSSVAQHRLRGILVAAEFAAAVILLVSAGLFLRSFARLQDVPPGFRPDHLLVADLPLSENAYSTATQRVQFFDRVMDRAGGLPGVSSAGAASFLPVSGGGGLIQFNIQGRAPKSPHDFVAAGYRTVTQSYFETLKIPLLKGRFIEASDTERSMPVAVINAAMARTFWPNDNPLGKGIQLGATPDPQYPYMQIVGIVGDVLQGLGDSAKAEMYVPYRQVQEILPGFQLSIVVRTKGDPGATASALRSAISEIDPNQPVVNIRSMEENIAASVAEPRFRAWLIGIFAFVALLLAAIGVYGVMSYSVTQRTAEIGIRVTMGAQPLDIFRDVIAEGLRSAAFGVGVGLVGALALSRVLQSFVFGVSAADPATFLTVGLVLTLVGLAATLFPARRATRVDPIIALRFE